MFLDLIRRRNPRLIEAAIALHQSGQLPANTYVIDLDAVEDNARVISTRAASLGLTVMAMTKQMGRNESFAMRSCGEELREASLSIWNALWRRSARAWSLGISATWSRFRNGRPTARPGCRRPGGRSSTPKRRPKPRRLQRVWEGAAAPRPHPRRERSILPRARGRVSRFRNRRGRGGARQDSGRPLRRDNDFPALLFDAASRTVRPTPNLELCDGRPRRWRARIQGIEINAPGTTSSATLNALGGTGRNPSRARTRADRNDPVACERRPA